MPEYQLKNFFPPVILSIRFNVNEVVFRRNYCTILYRNGQIIPLIVVEC